MSATMYLNLCKQELPETLWVILFYTYTAAYTAGSFSSSVPRVSIEINHTDQVSQQKSKLFLVNQRKHIVTSNERRYIRQYSNYTTVGLLVKFAARFDNTAFA